MISDQGFTFVFLLADRAPPHIDPQLLLEDPAHHVAQQAVSEVA